MAIADVSRVIQGLAAGVGFLGGGAILKLSAEREILGLTTAATIWMTAALGVRRPGRIGLAMVAVGFTWSTLSLVGLAERRLGSSRPKLVCGGGAPAREPSAGLNAAQRQPSSRAASISASHSLLTASARS